VTPIPVCHRVDAEVTNIDSQCYFLMCFESNTNHAFKSLNITKTINIFLAHSFLEKATNLFNATGHHACSPTPTKISIDILLPAAKTFGLKLA